MQVRRPLERSAKFEEPSRATRIGALALMLCLGLAASPARAAEAAGAPREGARQEAKTKFDEGVTAYREGRYREAIVAFLTADRLAPRPALSYNIAKAYERLDDTPGALNHYREYLRRDPTASNEFEVRRKIAELESSLRAQQRQRLTVLSQPTGIALAIDGEALGSTPWTGQLTPGRHQLELRPEVGASELWNFDLPKDHALELDVRLSKTAEHAAVLANHGEPEFEGLRAPGAAAVPPPSPRASASAIDDTGVKSARSPAVLITGAALTAIGVGLGVGFELAAQSEDDKLDRFKAQLGPSGCGIMPQPAECGEVADAARRYDRDRTLAIAGFATASVAAVGTVVYWLVTGSPSERSAEARGVLASRVRVDGAWLKGGGGALQLSGRF